jgi:hypothetical protein
VRSFSYVHERTEDEVLHPRGEAGAEDVPALGELDGGGRIGPVVCH